MNCSSWFPRSVLCSLYGICVPLILLADITAQGATYYVSTTGNDSNPGTSDHPWRNPQKCAASPIQAGDTCIVRNGTYTDPNGKGFVVYASGSSPSGSASQPIIIKSETPLGVMMVVPSSVNAANAAFYITRPYYIIEGFDISGGAKDGTSVSYAAIVFRGSATGGIARLNSIHHISRTICSDSPYGFSGILIGGGASDVLIERNQIYSIGRLRDGENGCSTQRFHHDHGIYLAGGPNIIVRRNVIYDVTRGWPIHVYGGTVTNLDISHNTFSGHSPTRRPAGHILLASTINGATIKNNISNDATIGMIDTYSLKASNVTVSYNLSDTLEKTGLNLTGVTFSNNIQRSTNLGFIDASQNDFRLTSSSAAINRGITVGVPPVKDGLPDIGAYEFSEDSDLSLPAAPTGLAVR